MAYVREYSDRNILPSIHGGTRPYSAGPYDVSVGPPASRYGPIHAWRDSGVFYAPRPPGEQTDAQEQLRMLREEMAKKDKLISQLAGSPRGGCIPGGSVPGGLNGFYPINSRDILNVHSGGAGGIYPLGGTSLHRDPGQQMRLDSLQNKVRELQAQLDAKEAKLRETKALYDSSREAEAKQATELLALRQNIALYEAQFGALEGAANRSGLAVSTLQRENQESTDRILELESRLRTHMEERERAEQERDIMEKKLREISSHFSTLVYIDPTLTLAVGGDCTPPMDLILEQTKHVVEEHAVLKGQVVTLREQIGNLESELRASRDTIARLIGEAERGQMSVSRYTLDMEGVRLERDSAVGRQMELQREVDDLRQRLDSTQRAWSTMRRDYEQRTTCHDPLEVSRSLEAQAKAFKECLATLLSDASCSVDPFEETIKDRVHSLVLALRDKNARIESLERQIHGMTERLDAQVERSRSIERKNKRVEADMMDLEDQLRHSEGAARHHHPGVATVAVERQYVRLLEQLCEALGMKPFPADLSLDGARRAVLGRANELCRAESESADRKAHIHNLQRKVKSLKDQLNTKEELLKLETERDKDGENKNKKLIKLVEKYKQELNETHAELAELKERLTDVATLKDESRQLERDIEKREVKVAELESIRQSQAERIRDLQNEVKDGRVHRCQLEEMGEELRAMRNTLGEVSKRNRQLLELRCVIARMLGLNVQQMSVADFEIVQRLERLILANQSALSGTVVLDSDLAHMIDTYRQGYGSSGEGLDINYAPPPPRTAHTPRGPRDLAQEGPPRSRSLSPNKRRDSRVY